VQTIVIILAIHIKTSILLLLKKFCNRPDRQTDRQTDRSVIELQIQYKVTASSDSSRATMSRNNAKSSKEMIAAKK